MPEYFIWLWYLAILILLIRRFTPEIYDVIIVKMTSVWYREVLRRLPEKARVLDVGIGTGTALAKNANLVQQKEIQLVGVDYDQAYVNKCEKVIRETSGLNGNCFVVCKSVYDEDLKQTVNKISSQPVDELFDAVYFSGSISLMPNPAAALQSTAELLKPEGFIYITQTFQRQGSKLLEIVKPLLKYITTIDFGKLTYERDVDKFLEESGLETVERSVIPDSIDNYFQAAFIIVLRKRN